MPLSQAPHRRSAGRIQIASVSFTTHAPINAHEGNSPTMLTHLKATLFPSGDTQTPPPSVGNTAAVPQEDCTACRAIGSITFLCISGAAFSEAWTLHRDTKKGVASEPRNSSTSNLLTRMFPAAVSAPTSGPKNPQMRVAFLTTAGVAFGAAAAWRWFFFGNGPQQEQGNAASG